jgi:hypothetical protein
VRPLQKPWNQTATQLIESRFLSLVVIPDQNALKRNDSCFGRRDDLNFEAAGSGSTTVPHFQSDSVLSIGTLDGLTNGWAKSTSMRKGVTTRKCANCPARGAAAMFARSAISAGTRFSRCLGGGEGDSVQESSVSRSKSDKKAHAFHLGTTTRCPPRCLPAAQSAQIHAKRLKLSNLGSLEPDNSDTFVSSPPEGAEMLTGVDPSRESRGGPARARCSNMAPVREF